MADQHRYSERPDENDGIDVPEVPYLDLYGEPRGAWVTDREYDPADLWEGVDYTAVDTVSELAITLNWDERDGWQQR